MGLGAIVSMAHGSHGEQPEDGSRTAMAPKGMVAQRVRNRQLSSLEPGPMAPPITLGVLLVYLASKFTDILVNC